MFIVFGGGKNDEKSKTRKITQKSHYVAIVNITVFWCASIQKVIYTTRHTIVLMPKITIKVEEPWELIASGESIPLGKHKIVINATKNEQDVGRCIIEITKIHPDAPPSTMIRLVGFPNRPADFFLSTREVLNGLMIILKKKNIARASFRAINSEPLIAELVKHSNLFVKRSVGLPDYYYFEPNRKPTIKKEFFRILRQKFPRTRKPIAPQTKPTSVGKKGTKRIMRG